MEIAALIISGLSFVIAIVGTALANKRSKEALAESRKAAATAIWSAVQQAVQRFIGFDPTTEPVGDRLADFRIATIALVDELDDWEGLDTWLESERALGTALVRQVMKSAQPGDSSDERLAALARYQLWAQVLGQNLRRFRKAGFVPAAASQLQAAAEEQIKAISAKHGWELPPTEHPGVSPLEL